MKTDDELKAFFRRMLAAPAHWQSVDDFAVAELKTEFAPLHEKIETFTEGLHQAKFEMQCVRADLGHEQRKCDRLLTALNEIMVKSHLCVFGAANKEFFQKETERLIGEINALACSFFGPAPISVSSVPPPLSRHSPTGDGGSASVTKV